MLNFLSDRKASISVSRYFSEATIPFLVLIIGVFSISSTAIFVKLAVKEVNVEGILFYRLLISTIVFAIWNWVLQLWQSRTGEDGNAITSAKEANRPALVFLICFTILLVITHITGRLLYMWSLKQTTAVNALTLSNLKPIFTFLGAWLFVGKQFDRRFLIGLAIAVGGGFFLTLEDWLHLENQTFGAMAILGDAAALLSALISALGMLIAKQLLKYLTNLTFLTWRSAISLAFIAPLVWSEGNSIIPTTTTGWFAILGFGLICGVLAPSLITYAFNYFSAPFMAIVFLIEPFPIAFFAWFFFEEVLSAFNIMGFILITLGIYLAQTGKGSS